jgi:HKD family nuclease
MLLTQESIRARFTELLAAAKEIDIAVAWITSHELAHEIAKFSDTPGRKARVIAGVYDYITSPAALRALNTVQCVKIAVPPMGKKFHVKLYLFLLNTGRRMCWIGSANLTNKGFSDNLELMYEYEEDGAAMQWFKDQWERYEHPNEEWLSSTRKSSPRCNCRC